MSNVKTANEAAQEVCAILGISNKCVSRVDIELRAGQIAVARVELVLTKEQWALIGAGMQEVGEGDS